MLTTKYVFALATVLTVALSPSAFAGGPFGLFDGCTNSCDSMCGASCDGSACGGACDSGCSNSACGLSGCGLFGNKGCDSGCDGGCGSNGCCDAGCDSPCGTSGCSLSGCGLFGNKGCDSGCCDSGCDGGCASGCDSGCDSMGCLSGGCGSYISLFGGWNELDSLRDGNIRVDFNDGIALGGAIGRRLGTSFRGELESSFRTNTGDIGTDGTTTVDVSGHLNTFAGMANLYYDIQQLQMFGVTPYAGAGLGFAVIDGDFNVNGTNIDLNDEEFAYQFIIGGSKQLRSGVAAFSEYRNFTVDSDIDLDMDTFIFGLRFDR